MCHDHQEHMEDELLRQQVFDYCLFTLQTASTTSQIKVDDYDADYKMIIMTSGDIKGMVTIWQNGIIEEEICTIEHNDLIFYLHYYLTDFHQFKRSLNRFIHTYLRKVNELPYSIVLCSHSGNTAAIIAELANNYVELANINIIFKAVSLDHIVQQDDVDLIYLAPQLSHLQQDIEGLLEVDIPVKAIDPTVYGSFNVHHLVKTCLTCIDEFE